VELPFEKFEANHGVDDDNKHDQQRDVQKGQHGSDYSVQDNLQAYGERWKKITI